MSFVHRRVGTRVTQASWQCLSKALVLAFLIVPPAVAHADLGPVGSIEDPAIQALAARAYADQFDVSLSTAYERVALQDATAPLVDDLRRAIGVDYAGAWYDADDGGKLKVGVAEKSSGTDESPLAAARAIVDKAGERATVEFVPVERSLAELEGAQDKVRAALVTQVMAENVEATIDVERNAVVVHVSNDLGAKESAAVASAVQATAIPVVVRRADTPAFHAEQRACALIAGSLSPSQLFCDPPLRGGVFMAFGGTAACTAGFLVFGNTGGKPFLMTAGHCLTAANGAVWNTRFADASLHAIGAGHSKVDGPAGDFGVTGIQNPSGWSATCCSRVWVAGVPGQTTQDSFYSLTTTNYAPAGTVLCNTSGPRLPNGYHTSCGTLLSGTYSAGGVAVLYKVSGMCAVDGSSGGPVYKNHVAYGIVSASDAGGCPTYYQAAPNAMTGSNVHLG